MQTPAHRIAGVDDGGAAGVAYPGDRDPKTLAARMLAAAASVAVHVAALALILAFAAIRPYADSSADAIAVDLVSADEVKPPPSPAEQQPAFDASAAQPAQPPSASPARQDPVAQTATAAPTPAPQTAAAQPPPAPPQTAWPPPMAAPQVPDITECYQVMLGLPAVSDGDEVGSAGNEGAKIEADAVAAMRARLHSCSARPAAIAPGDKVRIVMRIALTPKGELAAAPALVEASASAKGPLLMQAAVKALQDCQPYAMLPADKYREWRVLDISFTPQDFRG